MGFRPSPGVLTKFSPPDNAAEGPLRLDTHVREGYRIPTNYDSMIGKLIAWGEDRDAALARLREGIDQFEIEGVKTTLGLHRQILDTEAFASGKYDCRFMPQHPELLS